MGLVFFHGTPHFQSGILSVPILSASLLLAMSDSSSFYRLDFIRHSFSSYRMDDLSSPFTPQVTFGDDVFSKMTRGAICWCLSKSNMDGVVHFRHSECHLGDHPPGYVTIYPCFLSEVFLKLPLSPLIVSFLKYIGEFL